MATIKGTRLPDGSTYYYEDEDGRKEENLVWGGGNKVADVSPIGMALSSEHSANRLAFVNGNALTIEYSSDGGTTWSTNSFSVLERTRLCTSTLYVPIGRSNDSSEYTTSSRTRVTIFAQPYFYTRTKKLLINVSTSGGMEVLIEYKTGASGASWTQFGTFSLGGWSGWNDIPLILGTLGGDSTQTSNVWYLRLTFIMTSKNTTYPKEAILLGLRLFGSTDWTSASRTNGRGAMSSTGHLYEYDDSANATFPNAVSAVSFYENGVPLSSKYLTSHQSLAGYATESWVEGKGYLTSHQSLSGYATESWVNSKGYLTSHQDISGKLNTSGGTLSGNLTMYSASGDSPSIIFQRGALATDSYNDWKIVDSGGYLCFYSCNNAGSFTKAFEMRQGSAFVNGTEISKVGHTHSQYLTSHQDISGKQDKGKATVSGTEYTLSRKALVLTDGNGTSVTYNVLCT